MIKRLKCQVYVCFTTIIYLYLVGHTIELADCGKETWPKLVFLEIQSLQVWYLEVQKFYPISLSVSICFHLFVTFMSYLGSPGGEVTAAGIKKHKNTLRTWLEIQQVSQLS